METSEQHSFQEWNVGDLDAKNQLTDKEIQSKVPRGSHFALSSYIKSELSVQYGTYIEHTGIHSKLCPHELMELWWKS